MGESTMRARRRLPHSSLAVILAWSVSCSGGPKRIAPPSIDPEQAAADALQQLDKNGDELLDDGELVASPGLAAAKVRYDADQNGKLSETEIAAGVRRWAEGKMGGVSVSYVVQLDGRAPAGAEVQLTPEPFLGEAAKGAISETRRGISYLNLAPEDRPAGAPNIPLISPGLYRVSITHPTRSLPAKYNAETTLGIEIALDALDPGGVTWKLSSR